MRLPRWNTAPTTTPGKIPFQVYVRGSDAEKAFQQGSLECSFLQGAFCVRTQSPKSLAQAQIFVSQDIGHSQGMIFVVPICQEPPLITGWLFYGTTDKHAH